MNRVVRALSEPRRPALRPAAFGLAAVELSASLVKKKSVPLLRGCPVFGIVVVAGVLTLNIELKPESGTRSRISAILEVICNVPIAGGSTGQAEGIRLTVSGNTFTQFAGLTALLTPE